MVNSRQGLTLISRLRSLTYLFSEALLVEKGIEELFNKYSLDSSDVVLYSYWFDYSSFGISLFKKNHPQVFAISRAHGYDLYDERSRLGFHPFRVYKVKWFDRIYSVSELGKEYLIARVPAKYSDYKIYKGYLGVVVPKEQVKVNYSEDFLVVSCSSLVALKRVEIIAKSLDELDIPVRWVHFGGGPRIEALKELVSDMKSDKVLVEFRGHIANEDLYEFYSQNDIHLFLHASESEGLPVSIMEAGIFGIPVIAFDVGGIKEMVISEEYGSLIGNVDDVESFTKRIMEGLKDNQKFDRIQIANYYRDNFDQEKNYLSFAQEILMLSSKI